MCAFDGSTRCDWSPDLRDPTTDVLEVLHAADQHAVIDRDAFDCG